ncbi:calcium-binding protein [Mesorhizobium sp. LHD-90]|uniref:calcium-binding protein n=1 Tax=Mesorhizobium sp. LHD-90 TaxID=3071414 RepID=UPI0027E12D28|nr:calcium-binding protein [Mesorhizobium sp. LHD-90]MDQ6433539.1 calcium-binding protein [Mesorhizobium sp. LHD-90]
MPVTSVFTHAATKFEFQANTFEGGDQLLPDVTGLANGGFAVAYHSGTAATGSLQVDFYDAAHEVVGTFRTPYVGPTTVVGQPQVVQLENGNVVVAWGDSGEGFRARIYTESGVEVSLELALSFGGSAENLQISALNGGGFVATYGINDHIYQARFSENGLNLDGGFFQVDTGLVSAHDATVTALSGGGYVVTYTDTAPADQTIRARIYDADGSTLVNDFVVATAGDNTDSQVVGLGNNRWAVVYKDTGWQGGDAGNSGITLQIFDNNGLNVTPDLYQHVNTPSAYVESDPHITVLENGFIVVTWTRELSASDHDILARVYTPEGHAVTDEFTITVSGNLDVKSAVSGLLSGQFVTAWQDNTSDGDGGQISAAINEVVRVTTGDALDNVYLGDALRDNIAGLDGKDFLHGLGGDDAISGGDGNDMLYGQDGNDRLYGGADDDQLFGGAGDDYLAGEAGLNSLAGGEGNDTYLVETANDTVSELNSGGDKDRILVLDSYTLADGANIEILAANVPGGVDDLTLTGNGDDTHIIGNHGDNKIEGKGGVDTLEGLKGNDVYIVDNAADVIIETAGNGTADRVMARVDYTLAKDVDIELLTTTSSSGNSAINLTGNALAQEIAGNAGKNTLKDGGGAGDMLKGLAGDDVYLVYSAATQIVEGSSQGAADKVMVNVDYALGIGVYVEQLSTTNSNGNAAIDLTGNNLSQQITGNAGENILKDGGGAGDMLKGLAGDDIYLVYSADTQIIEGAAQGALDKVSVNVDYTLGAGVHVERLATTSAAGKAAIDLAGNEIAQKIVGNAGANIINGKGGSDTLQGLGGKDTFVFSSTLGAGNVDTVADFNAADDTIRLENAIFTKLAAAGALAAGNFRANASGVAVDANDYVVYETDTGKLFYDADGNGAGKAIQFAVLTDHPSITAADFVVI